MVKKLITALTCSLLFAVHANASTVSIIAPDKVTEGDTFEMQIVGDFGTDGLIAGGIQVFYDPSLFSIDSFAFNLAVLPDFSCPGAGGCPVDPAGVLSLVWGQFLIDLIPPGAGPTLMGTITATALAPSLGSDVIPVDFSPFTGGWFGTGFVTIATPDLIGASIAINPVPLPGAAWLMIGGLGALLRFRRG